VRGQIGRMVNDVIAETQRRLAKAAWKRRPTCAPRRWRWRFLGRAARGAHAQAFMYDRLYSTPSSGCG
jgi:hypothetical protein